MVNQRLTSSSTAITVFTYLPRSFPTQGARQQGLLLLTNYPHNDTAISQSRSTLPLLPYSVFGTSTSIVDIQHSNVNGIVLDAEFGSRLIARSSFPPTLGSFTTSDRLQLTNGPSHPTVDPMRAVQEAAPFFTSVLATRTDSQVGGLREPIQDVRSTTVPISTTRSPVTGTLRSTRSASRPSARWAGCCSACFPLPPAAICVFMLF